jgi:Tol biopolymer transport system component
MGEVYRAKDTRVERVVALKVLPEEFFEDEQRRARFGREARLLASLNHPGIAILYSFEEVAGRHLLAMELVEGEDLAQRLATGPLPLEDALSCARQLAEALEAAHESGIIHRDLKPGNIRITPGGDVKVLDFGLAKSAASGIAPTDDQSDSPTRSAAASGFGVVLGTAAYMSPEQARGRPVDKRTDIWSFGCVLYECLTGRKTFEGETFSDIVARILQGEPDLSALPAATPARVRALLARCLRKDPRERLRDIGDARLELADVISGGPEREAPPTPRRRTAWPVVAAAWLAGAALVAGGFWLAPKSARSIRRYSINVSHLKVSFFDVPALSHGGRFVAYQADGHLWVRDLQQFAPTVIAGADGASHPFWSPDDDQLGFEKGSKLYTIPAAGGTPKLLCSLPASGRTTGSCWLRDGSVYYSLYRGGVYSVLAAGSEPHLVLAQAANEEDFHSPSLLPDGKHLLAVAHRNEGPAQLVVVSLPDGKRTDVRAFDGLLAATWSPEGYALLYFVGPTKILAAPFSTSRLTITGEPVLVASGGALPSAASNGTLLYMLTPTHALREMVLLDASGRVLRTIGEPQRGLSSATFSPDGGRVAYKAIEKDVTDLWTLGLARGTSSRVVADSFTKTNPVWSPDGTMLCYEQRANSNITMWTVPADGSAAPRGYGPGSGPIVSGDGRWLVYVSGQGGKAALWRRPIDGTAPPEALTKNKANSEDSPSLSPNGRWLAYVSDEGGKRQVFVRGYSGGEDKQQISLEGGSSPFWGALGDAIYFESRDTLHVVSVRPGATLAVGSPSTALALRDLGLEGAEFHAAAHGGFLVTREVGDDPQRGLLLVENWAEELRRR